MLDNDGALEVLGDLFGSIETHGGEELATFVGLSAWLRASVGEHLITRLKAETLLLRKLPAKAQTLLSRAAKDPEGFADGRSRSARLLEILGPYSDGPRYDALLLLPGGAVVIQRLASNAAEGVDDAWREDLHEASSELGQLAPLLELAEAGLWRPRLAQVKQWRRGLERLDDETDNERDYWDVYVGNVKRGLKLLAKHANENAP